MPGASATGNSYLSTFKRCRRKFYYQNVRGLRTKGRSPALDTGTLTHEGLALLSEQGLDFAIDFVTKMWNEDMADSYTNDDPLSVAKILLTNYVEIYVNDPFTPLVEEDEFEFDLGGFVYTGKCDKLVSGPGDSLFVMEHKTTGLNPNMYLRSFYLDPQITGYYIGASESVKSMGGGKGISGIILDVLGKPRKLKNGWGQPTFTREVFTRTEDDINDFLSSTKQVFQAIATCKTKHDELEFEGKEGKNAYYRCEHECFSFNRACAYIELCRYGENEDLILEMFDVDKPLVGVKRQSETIPVFKKDD